MMRKTIVLFTLLAAFALSYVLITDVTHAADKATVEKALKDSIGWFP